MSKHVLLEAYKDTRKYTGFSPIQPGGNTFRNGILSNNDHFNYYVQALSEGLSRVHANDFKVLADGTRRCLLENSVYGVNPYETLALPLLRVFYPKTIAKELVNVIPMNRPEIIRGFIRSSFSKFGSSTKLMAPSMTDVSGGPAIGTGMSVVTTVTLGAASADKGKKNLLDVAGLDKSVSHIEKTVVIKKIVKGADSITTTIVPTVDGAISAAVSIGGTDYMLMGSINYLNGDVNIQSSPLGIDSVDIASTLSYEENTINPKAEFNIEKIRITAKDRVISTEWSIQAEQDLKALFDVNLQAELVSVMGNQIALDIDREVATTLIYVGENLAGNGHTDTFDVTPPANFTWGPKQWIENIIPKLSSLSAKIYSDTNIDDGNVVAANPEDACYLESLQEYRYNGSGAEDGEVGYESATIAGKKWKVFTSTVIPKGKMLMAYKPVEDIKACYIFAPYAPAIVSPWPMGNKPSLTLMSRYGTQLIRPQGYSVLNIKKS